MKVSKLSTDNRPIEADASPISGVGPMSALSRVCPDEFTPAMLATLRLGFLLPCRDTSAVIFGDLAAAAIGFLFFLQGARLSRAAIIAGALHWRLHMVIFAATFVLFPGRRTRFAAVVWDPADA